MGLNVNLITMLGVSGISTCPKCHELFDNNFDVYDIEGGSTNRKPGEWKLREYCPHCEHEFTTEFKVVAKTPGDWAAYESEVKAGAVNACLLRSLTRFP